MKKWILLALAATAVFYFMREKPTIKNLNNPGQTIVAFGDSLTAGYGAPRGASYPDVLAQQLGRPVVNLGLNGDTSAAAVSRLPLVLEQNPYMVLIEFGGNDFMHGVPFDETERALRELVKSVQAAGAVAVVVDTGGYSQMGRYGRLYKQIAREEGALFVPGILDGIFQRNQYKADPIHPNAAGYKIVADRVYKVISPYVH